MGLIAETGLRYGEMFSPVDPFKRSPGISEFQSQPNMAFKQ